MSAEERRILEAAREDRLQQFWAWDNDAKPTYTIQGDKAPVDRTVSDLIGKGLLHVGRGATLVSSPVTLTDAGRAALVKP